MTKKTNKWGRKYWADLGERVGSTALYSVITLITATSTTTLSVGRLWPVVGLPVALALCKGLLANLKDSESGPSLLPSPPAPDTATDQD